jgi:hypothetical protein
MFRYQNLTTNGKWLTDLVFNAIMVLGGLALLGWIVGLFTPAK